MKIAKFTRLFLVAGLLLLCVDAGLAQTTKPDSEKPAPTVLSIQRDLDALFAKAGASKATNPNEEPEQANDVRRTVEAILTLRDQLAIEQQWNTARQTAASTAAIMQGPRLRLAWQQIANDITVLIRSNESTLVQSVRKAIADLPRNLAAAKTAEEVRTLQNSLRSLQSKTDQQQMWSPEVRESLNEPRQQLSQNLGLLETYAQMLTAEAEGDMTRAMDLGTSISTNRIPRPLIADVVRDRVEAIRTARDAETHKIIDEAKAGFTKAKDSTAVLEIANKLQGLLDKLPRTSSSESQDRLRWNAEISRLRRWAAALDFESRQMYRTALQRLRVDTGGADPIRAGSLRGYTCMIVTDDLLRARINELSRKLAERGTAPVDADLQKMVRDLSSAKTFYDIMQLPKRMTQTVQSMGEGAFEDQPVVDEVNAAMRQINLLVSMDAHLHNREWASFWQNNQIFASSAIPHRWASTLATHRINLIRRALIDSGEAGDWKIPDGDKSLDRALLEQVDAELGRENYRRATQLLQLYVRIFYVNDATAQGPGQLLVQELAGIDMYVQALSFEEAGDWLQAISRYRAVIQRSGKRVPVAKATQRLSAILTAHPDLVYAPASPAPPAVPVPAVPTIPPGGGYPRTPMPPPSSAP